MESSKRKRPDYVRLYKTAAWQRMRKKVLSKFPICEMCKRKGIITESRIADHKIPHKGDIKKFFDMQNLWGLCSHCHESTKKRIENSGNFGCDENGIVEAWK